VLPTNRLLVPTNFFVGGTNLLVPPGITPPAAGVGGPLPSTNIGVGSSVPAPVVPRGVFAPPTPAVPPVAPSAPVTPPAPPPSGTLPPAPSPTSPLPR
jgi:hypothetical protein